MVTAQLVGRLCGLGALLLVGETAQAQPASSKVRADTGGSLTTRCAAPAHP